MKIKYNAEIIAGGLFSLVGLVLWILIPSQIATKETSAINAQTIPSIAVGGLILFSVLLFLQGLFLVSKREIYISKEQLRSESFQKECKPLLFGGILIAYLFAITHLGFIISTLALVVAMLAFYNSRKWYFYLIATGTVFLVYYVFAEVLYVSLP